MTAAESGIFEQIHNAHLELFMGICNADGGKMYPVDIYAMGCLKRSMALCKGFQLMMETNNLICAGAIIRQQLDTLLRLFALFIVKNPHETANQVFDGHYLRKLKDKDDRPMTDHYLVEKLSEKYPWVKKVYQETSGYVHFSAKHIFSIFVPSDEDRTIAVEISPEDNKEVRKAHREAMDAFVHITEILLLYVKGWVLTKDRTHPDLKKEPA